MKKRKKNQATNASLARASFMTFQKRRKKKREKESFTYMTYGLGVNMVYGGRYDILMLENSGEKLRPIYQMVFFGLFNKYISRFK